MKIKFSTLIYTLLSIIIGVFYISIVRPVGWFDSVFAIFLGLLVFFLLKKIKGIIWK
jgi:hypothetical protein